MYTRKHPKLREIPKIIKEKSNEEKKKPKKKKNIIKSLSKQADTLWSLAIRKFWYCRYCWSENNLNAHHIFSRKNYSTRWEISNGICLCVKHHTFNNEFSAHRTPTEFTYWLEERLWRNHLEKLWELSRIPLKITQEYLKEKIREFKIINE